THTCIYCGTFSTLLKQSSSRSSSVGCQTNRKNVYRIRNTCLTDKVSDRVIISSLGCISRTSTVLNFTNKTTKKFALLFWSSIRIEFINRVFTIPKIIREITSNCTRTHVLSTLFKTTHELVHSL